MSVYSYTSVLPTVSYGYIRPTSATPAVDPVWYSVTVRTSAAGVIISGSDLGVGAPPFNGFELLPNVDYVFNVEWLYGQETLMLYNSSGSDVTVTALLASLR